MDSGMFQCLAFNPAGNIQSSAFLNVFHAGNMVYYLSKIAFFENKMDNFYKFNFSKV